MGSLLSNGILAKVVVVTALLACNVPRGVAASTPLMTVSVRGPFMVENQEQLYCDSSYSLPECRTQIEALKRALQLYPTALLPNWKWVLVRAERWKPLAASLHLNTESPAITLLDDNTTLLEESLIAPRAERAAELINSYKIALDQLLDVAIAHELGHAICHEQNELRADEIGRDIRRQIAAGGPVSVKCLRPLIPNSHAGR
jgi:hypothetical protein